MTRKQIKLTINSSRPIKNWIFIQKEGEYWTDECKYNWKMQVLAGKKQKIRYIYQRIEVLLENCKSSRQKCLLAIWRVNMCAFSVDNAYCIYWKCWFISLQLLDFVVFLAAVVVVVVAVVVFPLSHTVMNWLNMPLLHSSSLSSILFNFAWVWQHEYDLFHYAFHSSIFQWV